MFAVYEVSTILILTFTLSKAMALNLAHHETGSSKGKQPEEIARDMGWRRLALGMENCFSWSIANWNVTYG